MHLMDFLFGKKKSSASKAKERLQLIIAHERGSGTGLLRCEELQRELTAVIARHVGIDTGNVKICFDKNKDFEVIEVKIELPPQNI